MVSKHTLKGLILAVTLAAASVSSAALVNISSNSWTSPGKFVVTSTGALLPLGSAVRIGIFASAPVITSTTTFASINSLFTPLGENTADANDGSGGPLSINDINPLDALNTRGHYAGQISGVENGDSRFSTGTRLYVMVLNQPAATMFDATEWAIFSDAAWTIPSTGARSLTTVQISDSSEVYAGTNESGRILMAAVVPEPSVSLLALGAVAFGLRRRR